MMSRSRLLKISIAVLAVCVLIIALASCGGHKRKIPAVPEIKGASPNIESLSAESLADALTELDALETPDGVDAALFEELKDALGSQLESRPSTSAGKLSSRDSSNTGSRLENRDTRFEGKFVSAPPGGDANRISNLRCADNADGTYTLSWHYRNCGDYDQDGTVGVSDITPLAQHFGEAVPENDAQRNSLVAVADGSGNGVVDIADVTPLAANLGIGVHHYQVEGAGQLDGYFSGISEVPLDSGVVDARRRLTFTGPLDGCDYIRVVSVDEEGVSSKPSNVVYVRAGRGDWWAYGRNEKRNRRSPFVGPQTPAIRWIRRPWLQGALDPIIDADGRICVNTFPYIYEGLGAYGIVGVCQIIESDGSSPWDPAFYIASVPAWGTDGTVYASGMDRFCAINYDRSLQWDYELMGGFVSPVIAPDGTIYAPSTAPPGLTALTPEGVPIWEFSPACGSYPPAIGDDGTVYVPGKNNCCLYAIAPDGTLKWSYDILMSSCPAIGEDGTIYFTGGIDELLALKDDGSSARLKWTFPTGRVKGTSPALDDGGTVYVAASDGSVWAIRDDGESSALLWRYRAANTITSSSPAVDAEGTIYVGCDDYYLYAIYPTGDLKWRCPTGGKVQSSVAIGEDGTLYFGCGGSLYAVSETGNLPPVASLAVDLEEGVAPLTVTFDASASYDPDGGIVDYEWNFGEYSHSGYTSSGTEPFEDNRYDHPGNYTCWIRIEDNEGAVAMAEVVVKVNPTASPPGWVRTWRSIGGYEYARDMVADADGYVYAVGETSGFGAGGTDIFVLKYSPEGNLLWTKTWGGILRESVDAVALGDTSHSVYVTGSTQSFGAGGSDLFLLKYDAGGDLLWQRVWGGNEDESPASVTTDESGYVYVTGSTTSFGVRLYGYDDIFLVKYNSDGGLLWQRTWGGTGCDRGKEVVVDSDGSIVVGGDTSSRRMTDGAQMVILRYDSIGNLAGCWAWCGLDDAYLTALMLDDSGNILLTADVWGYEEAINGVLLAKFNTDEAFLWSQCWDGSDHEYGRDVAVDAAGDIYVVGNTQDYPHYDGALLLKYDSDGALIWQRAWNEAGYYGGWALAFNADGSIYIGGSAHSTLGEWEEISGTVSAYAAAAVKPMGYTISKPSGTVTYCHGTETTPAGVQDEGGLMVMKLEEPWP